VRHLGGRLRAVEVGGGGAQLLLAGPDLRRQVLERLRGLAQRLEDILDVVAVLLDAGLVLRLGELGAAAAAATAAAAADRSGAAACGGKAGSNRSGHVGATHRNPERNRSRGG
jgi:hypothetical protein